MRRAITLAVKDYDHIQPLATGAVVAEGVDLRLLRTNALADAMADESIAVVELSWARHIKRLSDGDLAWVAIPVFPRRAFGHRAWYVRRGSGYSSFADMNGRLVGTNEWPATGNTWARAAAREQGVSIEHISWVVGSIDGASIATMDRLPPHARYAEPRQLLLASLLNDELDALVCPVPPRGFYDAQPRIERLIRDFRLTEQGYYQRTKVFPAHHVIGIRRRAFEADPSIARIIFDAMVRSRLHWQASRRYFADTSPWVLADIEEAMEIIGKDWQPDGLEASRVMTRVLCDEMFAQNLIDQRIDPSEVFAEFAATNC